MGMNHVSCPYLCPLRPVYTAQKLIFAQRSRNAGDDGASEKMLSWSRVAYRAEEGRPSLLLHPLCTSEVALTLL